MSELERIEEKIHELDNRQTGFEVRFDMYMRKTDELIRLQREELKEFKAKHDLDMARLIEDSREERQELKAMNKHTQNLVLGTMASMGALTVAVIGFIWTMATR
jgi:cell division protein FtsX